MKNVYEKYQGKSIEDTGSTVSKDFKQFCSYFKRRLKVNAEERGMELVNFSQGHYDFSGMLKKGDKYAYFSYNLQRDYWSSVTKPIDFNKSGCSEGFLLRKAAHDKDYKGGLNNFCSLDKFMDLAEELTTYPVKEFISTKEPKTLQGLLAGAKDQKESMKTDHEKPVSKDKGQEL